MKYRRRTYYTETDKALMWDLVEGGSDAGSVMASLIAGPTAVAIVLMLSFSQNMISIKLGSGGSRSS